MSGPRIVLIAAVARNRVIGDEDRLPWRLPTDLRHFKSETLGKPVIMGRKTFVALPGPLAGRRLIVVSRRPSEIPIGVLAADSIDEALAIGAREAETQSSPEIMVAGGAEIYAQTIGRADALRLTEVDLQPEGDALFPAIDPARWRETRRQRGARGPRDDADFAFVDYEPIR